MSKNLELVKKAWENVSSLHPKIRQQQNKIANVELGPAKIEFGWWKHLWRSDYTMLAWRPSSIIVVDQCYVRDFNSNTEARVTLGTLENYILDKVARAEGVRTANLLYLPQHSGLWDYEPYGIMQMGNWIGYESMNQLKLPTLPLSKSSLIKTREDFDQNLSKPNWATDLGYSLRDLARKA